MIAAETVRYREGKTCTSTSAGASNECTEPAGADAGEGAWAGPNFPDFEDGDPVYVMAVPTGTFVCLYGLIYATRFPLS